MSSFKKVPAPKEFADNFAKVAKYYCCQQDEIEIMKQLARANLPASVESFGLMAKEISSCSN